MANTPIRKTLERLIKKVEELENQSFAQKLHIDELENKLDRTEEALKQIQENPYGALSVSVPAVWTSPYPTGVPQNAHICVAGPIDWTGGLYCSICGAHMSGPTWTVTSTADSFSSNQAQSSSDVEPVQDFDISWVIPDDLSTKKD